MVVRTRTGDEGVADPAVGVPARNEILVVGRLTRTPVDRTLPSGDRLVTFGVTVPRRPDRPGGPPVDALDCVAWTADLQDAVVSWTRGDVVEVRGALRRRFWRTGAGAASRCEIEAARVHRLAAAADQTGSPA